MNEYIKEKMTDWYAKERFVMFDHIRDFSNTAGEIRKFKPDVVFDDYLQLIQPHGKFDQRRLQLEQLVNDYKWVAKENRCAVVLASQLNRAIETRTDTIPQLSDLAESGAIEQVAENVFFVYYGYKAYPDKFDPTELTMVASKVRYGETGDSILYFEGDKCLIDDDKVVIKDEPKEEESVNEEIPF